MCFCVEITFFIFRDTIKVKFKYFFPDTCQTNRNTFIFKAVSEALMFLMNG